MRAPNAIEHSCARDLPEREIQTLVDFTRGGLPQPGGWETARVSTPSSRAAGRPVERTVGRGRRPGAPDTRAEILASARELFAARGFGSTSVRAIAADAGVDPSLVHHYFGTKDDLFLAALEIPVDPGSACSGPSSACGTTRCTSSR